MAARGYQGKDLEKIVDRYRSPGVVLFRIQDAAAFGRYKGPAVPCDFIGSILGHPVMLDCKETAEDRIPFSKMTRPQSSHQLEAMLRFVGSNPRCVAGYLCSLKEGYVFAPAIKIQGKGSVKFDGTFRQIAHGLPFNLIWLILGS